MDTDAVILAVASPPGRSARGIVRISGAGAFDLLDPFLVERSHREPEAPRLRAAVLRLNRAELPCLMISYHGPRSYTGEDAVELQLPGNPALLERIVDELIASARTRERGLEPRRAEPGEFTARAFLHGRIGLTEAEGVAATIAARSDAELRAARLLLTGRLGGFARESADDLAALLALVEAGIDFTDQEDVQPIGPADLVAEVTRLHDLVEERLAHAVGLEQLEAIPWVVLTGEPNSGKSTLFNALLEHERAVVSRVAGTTRDVLAEPLTVATGHGPAEVMLVDVAGADVDGSGLGRAMHEAARDAIERAELLLHCSPGSDGRSGDPATGAPAIRLATKSDLAGGRCPPGWLAVSAKTGRGVAALRAMIGDRLSDRAVSLAADSLALGPRHQSALRDAAANLSEAIGVARRSRHDRVLGEVELIASSLRAALDALASLAGDVTPDDVLGRIFAGFCIGK